MTARNHHYLPQCYLKGFTKDRKKPKLFVVDAKEKKYFSTHPRNVAAVRDFNRVDAEGLAPDALESALGNFESDLAPVLEKVCATRTMSDTEDRAWLLNLVAMTALRNPRHRENFRTAREQTARIMMDMVTATPERFASQLKGAQEAGYIDDTGDVDYETMRKFVNEGQFKVDVHPMDHSRTELVNYEKILPYFFARRWTLLKADPSKTGFVTSDHPFGLMWSDGQPQGFFSPGLGHKNTVMYFPISNDLALIGRSEGRDGAECDLDERSVAMINAILIGFADKQIYARDQEFKYLLEPDKQPQRGADILNDILARKAQ